MQHSRCSRVTLASAEMPVGASLGIRPCLLCLVVSWQCVLSGANLIQTYCFPSLHVFYWGPMKIFLGVRHGRVHTCRIIPIREAGFMYLGVAT
jgi:hypothetical protein